MSKYYKVCLSHVNLCVICKKVPFTKDLYQEIITDRIIYPKNNKVGSRITYSYTNGKPNCYEISNSEVKEWLSKLDKDNYLYNLERIEHILKNSHKIEVDAKTIYRRQEKLAAKEIKKTLRRIK